MIDDFFPEKCQRRMNPIELKERTIRFTFRVLKFADALPNKPSGRTIAGQVARNGCSVASNYRSALRGKSHADFVNKITIVLEEADETDFWIEIAAGRQAAGGSGRTDQDLQRHAKNGPQSSIINRKSSIMLWT
jgi:four helix bundle protein